MPDRVSDEADDEPPKELAAHLAAVIERALDEWLAAKIGHLMGVLFQGMAASATDTEALDRMVVGAALATEAWLDAHSRIFEMVDPP